MRYADTIVAIATARGRSALAIVRLSGPQAMQFAAMCFIGEDLRTAASHTAHVGLWRGADGTAIDHVVTTVFRAPRSATGEDVVEVSCHGGDYVAARIIESVIASGARLAEPGEFTQRAFLNGKMDLAQAEAVADLIHASSALAHRVSVAHLRGHYSESLSELRATMLEICALAELELDFPDEDVEFADRTVVRQLLDRAEEHLTTSLGSHKLGVLIREGVRVVIAGRPNAGKSTLLNAVLGQDRAIVSSVPGTTRDTIEADTEVEGILFRFVDTAGMRESANRIEAEGIHRAVREAMVSDILIYVYDVTIGLSEQETAWLRDRACQSLLVVVGNKSDLCETLPDLLPIGNPVVILSAKQAMRDPGLLAELWHVIVGLTAAELREANTSRIVTNQRHQHHMKKALRALHAARQSLDAGRSGDLFTLDIRAALHEIGAITGEVTNDDVLGEIFSRFCIGK